MKIHEKGCHKRIAHPACSSVPGQYTVHTGAGEGAQLFYGLLRFASQSVSLLSYTIEHGSMKRRI